MWTSSTTIGAVAARIMGVIPDLLTCFAMVGSMILTWWLIRKAKADTKLSEKNAELKDLEIKALRAQGQDKIIIP